MLILSIREIELADSETPPQVTQDLDLAFTPALERELSPIYERLSHVIPAMEWPVFAPYIKAINDIKREKNAVILAHNYMTPEIFHGVADIVGDSLALAKEASDSEADIIVLAGVHFMAETAKILNPEKKVLIPDSRAGCSLAESMTGEDVRLLKEAFPGVPVVSYVNTPADVKAETDVCCTSSNALHVVESLGVTGFCSSLMSTSPRTWQTRRKSRFWPGEGVARFMSASVPQRSGATGRVILIW